ncbi:hypothetical protein GH714_033598 [Hevea brasiliensis]|uniref:Uncharacterized protein n=1 Tax=Hevea brasiliensis TaxID=3981 RepID=A0A6A6NDF4_HEVBR|nr:hypothetical protein GH714_033598 [Hevea brasiliensis]
MERQRSTRPGTEILRALQKLKEILHQKDMQFASVELDVHSSQNNLSVVKNLKSNASSSKLKATDELRLAEEISEDFTAPHAAMKEEETDMHKVTNGKNLLTDSRNSNSNGVAKLSLANSSKGEVYSNSREDKQVLHGREIEQLSERLKFLEAESKNEARVFGACDRKKKLVNEIYKQFQTIYRCLQLENLVNGERGFDISLLVNPFQEAGLETGLPEVLWQDSIPSNVTRDQSSNILALGEVPEGTWVHAHQNE